MEFCDNQYIVTEFYVIIFKVSNNLSFLRCKIKPSVPYIGNLKLKNHEFNVIPAV